MFGKSTGPNHLAANAHAPKHMRHRRPLARPGQAQAIYAALFYHLAALAQKALIQDTANRRPSKPPPNRGRQAQSLPTNGPAHSCTRSA